MRRGIFLILSLILTLSILSSFALAAPKANSCPIKSDTDFAFYGQTGTGGVGTPSKSWMIHFLNWWKTQDPMIDFVQLDANDVKSDCNLASFPNLKLYIQPGGNAYYQQKTLGSSGKNNILNYINSGKAYYGACAGFFYAAGDYYWQGNYYNWPNLLGIYPTLEGSITNIADYDQSPGYALTSLSNGFETIYYGGPTRGWQDTPSGYLGIADSTFSDIPNDLPAVVKYNKMLLTSVHLEAFENDGITGLTTEQRTENYKYLANLINEVAGTSYFVPAYNAPPAPFQCGDGIDNDGDGLIDMDDSGCSSLSDNDEFNFISNGTNMLFEDGFEQGLGAWSLSGIDTNWYVSNIDSQEGAYHAEAKPMNTNEPASIMEKGLGAISYNNIEFSYYRKLVGIDIADEFKVKWFDGSDWNILEQTGDASPDDLVYAQRTFTLPGNNPDFRIRFECTAGAVSETCSIDNVKVLGF